MLREDFKFQLSLDYVQFIIAISLDNNGFSDAAKHVMAFQKVFNSKHSDSTAKLRKRERVWLEFLDKSKNSKKSVLEMVIEEFYFLDVLPVNYKKEDNSSFTSLAKLGVNLSPKNLYEACMSLVVSKNHILLLYMDTTMFFEEFKKWLNANYRWDKFHRLNDLSDEKCRELLQPVKRRTQAYFLDGYDMSVSTPNNYIFSALNNYFADTKVTGEYRDSEVSDFFKILNSRGQDRIVLGGDGKSLSSLSFIGVSLNDFSLDFSIRDVVYKIFKASKEVYTHNNSEKAFYDIFSRYRDKKLKESNAYSSLNSSLSGCNVVKYVVSENFTYGKSKSGDFEGYRQKMVSREEYLRDFDKILVNGKVALEEIVAIYDSQLETSDRLPNRENKILYRTKDRNIRGKFKNGERFLIIYEGFVALAKLLKFIESPQNTYGVTLNSVNVQVFRDSRLAALITDLKSFTDLGIKSSLLRAQVDYYDGIDIKTNITVFEEMQKLKESELFFKSFKSLPINLSSYRKKILEKEEQEKKKKQDSDFVMMYFKDKVTKFNPKIDFCGECDSSLSFVINFLNGYDVVFSRKLAELSIFEMIKLYAACDGVFDLTDCSVFRTVMRYLGAVEVLMCVDGCAFVRENGCVDLSDTNKFLNYLEGVADSYQLNFKGVSIGQYDAAYREEIINCIFSSMFGKVALQYWEKLKILFSVSNFYAKLLAELQEITNYFNLQDTDRTLLMLHLCRHLKLIEFDMTTISVQKLYKLYDFKHLSYPVVDLSVNEILKNKKTFEWVVNKYYTSIFRKSDNSILYSLLKQLSKELNCTFEHSGSETTVSVNLMIKLQKLNSELVKRKMFSLGGDSSFTSDNGLLNRFLACAVVDNETGFAKIGNTIYTAPDGAYLHETGCIVFFDLLGNATFKPLTENYLSNYQMSISCFNL